MRDPLRQKLRALVHRSQVRRPAAWWREPLLPAAYAVLPIWPLMAAALARDLSYALRAAQLTRDKKRGRLNPGFRPTYRES